MCGSPVADAIRSIFVAATTTVSTAKAEIIRNFMRTSVGSRRVEALTSAGLEIPM